MSNQITVLKSSSTSSQLDSKVSNDHTIALLRMENERLNE